MVRNAMFQQVQLAARDRYADLAALETPRRARRPMNAAAWEEALGAYWDEYETIDDGPAARSPELLIDRRAPSRARGTCARSSTTPRATTTGRSSPRSTSTPPTPPASR